MSSRIWFITGTSRGFGREWALAALERGDRVVATARSTAALDDLVAAHGDAVLPMALDVTDRAAVERTVGRAAEHFGRLDIVVNNAGYGLFGMIEEVTEQQARAQVETNVFGALWVTRAALPHLRAAGGGHIIQVSSIGGITAFPGLGLYHASKWALEGLSQSLAAEVADFGIRVTLVEPTGYQTDWAAASAVRTEPIAAYDPVRERAAARRAAAIGRRGDPTATRAAILAIVDAERPPLRIFLGDGPLRTAVEEYTARIATWQEWEAVSIAAHGATDGTPAG